MVFVLISELPTLIAGLSVPSIPVIERAVCVVHVLPREALDA